MTSHFRTEACNRAALHRAGHFAVTLLVITETVPFDMCIGFKMLAVEVVGLALSGTGPKWDRP